MIPLPNYQASPLFLHLQFVHMAQPDYENKVLNLENNICRWNTYRLVQQNHQKRRIYEMVSRVGGKTILILQKSKLYDHSWLMQMVRIKKWGEDQGTELKRHPSM